MPRRTLPIDVLLSEIVSTLKENCSLILKATPGAGKTTRVPYELLKVTEKKVLVLEPRRIAAILSAKRVSEELEQPCGQLVGYQVRFDKKESADTRLKYVTEGLFLRLLLQDCLLKDVGCVVLDEFHERHLYTDVALMALVYLQKTLRPELKIVVMSATLDNQLLEQYLFSAKVLVCETQNFPVNVEYLPEEFHARNLDLKVLWALEKILKTYPHNLGHILVFLPGKAEIDSCESILRQSQCLETLSILKLTAESSPVDQEKVFINSSQRKIILSTNVAETSVTIDGVSFVVDAGLAKVGGHATWSGLTTLTTKPVSQSSCIQRMGRAGRTKEGYCFRLFSVADFHRRPKFAVSEIKRVDLSQILLEVLQLCEMWKREGAQETSFEALPWLEQPSDQALQSTSDLLETLGAIDAEKNITSVGEFLSQQSLSPRLGRILLESKKLGCFPQGLRLVSILSEWDFYKNHLSKECVVHSDISYLMEKSMTSLSNGHLFSWKKVELHLKYLCVQNHVAFPSSLQPLPEDFLTQILFTGFPDMICALKENHKSIKRDVIEYQFCLGGSASLSISSAVAEESFVIAIDARERFGKISLGFLPIEIYAAHGLNVSFLLQSGHKLLTEEKKTIWNSQRNIVQVVQTISYGKLTLSEVILNEDSSNLEDILLLELKKSWPKPFENDQPINQYNARVKLAQMYGECLDFPLLQSEDFELFLIGLCEGKKSFESLVNYGLSAAIENYVGYDKIYYLNSILPSSLKLTNGRTVNVNYENEKQPFISSRLQDFFGTEKTPTVFQGKIHVVVHLMAPNKQAVQVTTDLQGFWRRGYQEIRKELSRKYPRHSWPDDPKNAEPPPLHTSRKKNC